MEHIEMTCENHKDLRWFTKDIAVNGSDGRYNGSRHVFFALSNGDKPECSCDASKLIALSHI